MKAGDPVVHSGSGPPAKIRAYHFCQSSGAISAIFLGIVGMGQVAGVKPRLARIWPLTTMRSRRLEVLLQTTKE